MKKNAYLAPSVEVIDLGPESMIAASITSIGGNSGLGLGNNGETPTSADAFGHRRGSWSNGWD